MNSSEVKLATGGHEVRKTSLILWAMVLSLELYVCSERAWFLRFVALIELIEI